MKTVHIDCGREMAGGQWQVVYLVERLEGAILLARESSPLYCEAQKRGLDVRGLSILGLRRAAKDAQIVHAHDSRAHSMAPALSGAPLVVSRRVGFAMKRSVLSDFKYEAARMFLAVSEYAASRMRERGVDPSRIRVVYDGVPIPPRPSSRTGGVVAIAKARSDAIDHASRSLNVPVKVISDLWQDLATASVCIYLSEMEGLGSGAIAAMACGVPVIASRVGGLPEAVEHEKTGVLIDSPRELEPTLRRLLENADLASEMGERAREVAKRKFSVETMVQQTVCAYNEVLR
ncbi:MAG TPA: glycosyltransferase family 4 protein [Bryobacteraceae bacterium]|nr:glycosyltransferase family 4 protein [Bryobacteraceae bacterium]